MPERDGVTVVRARTRIRIRWGLNRDTKDGHSGPKVVVVLVDSRSELLDRARTPMRLPFGLGGISDVA